MDSHLNLSNYDEIIDISLFDFSKFDGVLVAMFDIDEYHIREGYKFSISAMGSIMKSNGKWIFNCNTHSSSPPKYGVRIRGEEGERDWRRPDPDLDILLPIEYISKLFISCPIHFNRDEIKSEMEIQKRDKVLSDILKSISD